jgi:quercetin dioxygenase-like cupin family protein
LKMNRVQMRAILGIFASLLFVETTFFAGELQSQEKVGAGHEHMTGVACDDVAPGKERPEFGCFNIATEKGLQFPQQSVYWHIRTFASRDAAEAAKSTTGIVVEEDGRVWLSEFGARDLVVKGGEPIAIVGPLELPPAKSYTAVLSYAAMRPGDRSRVHTHPGPEGWYMLIGEQCLETPAGANRAKAGGTMTAPANVPMELNITGTVLRKSLVLVIHDSSEPRGTPSEWKPTGACSQ